MIKRAVKSLINFRNKRKWSRLNVRFLQNTVIAGNCFFEGNNSVGENGKIIETFFGRGSYTGRNTEFTKVKIGRFCSIGSFVRNTTGRHPVSDFISSHPAFFSPGKAAGFTLVNEQKFEEFKYAGGSDLVRIGNDVWIGDNVLIQDGVTIGDGAIIGSNSLVTKDLEPYSVNVGSPAKMVKYRFEPELINFLLEYKWWDKDLEWLRQYAGLFADPAGFIQQIKALK